jgi:CRISPR-associated protein Csb2
MIAFAFTFPGGRYHATPWGRNANEADVAWPPEPVRILRSLIATWWRKADQEAFPKAQLDDLIDVLAGEVPLYRLPAAVHSHIRTYMPAPRKPPGTLIYDAFLRLGSDAELIVLWPNAALTADQRALAAHLLERIGYLGRAESWADGSIVEAGAGEVGEINAFPRALAGQATVAGSEGAFRLQNSGEFVPFDATASTTPQEWVQLRAKLLDRLEARSRQRSLLARPGMERLANALAVDTSDWRKEGWSCPPPLRKVVYDRPAVGPLPPRRHPVRRAGEDEQPGSPEAARFVLAGRPPPRVEDTLRIAEVARAALMSKFKKDHGERPPIEISGRNEEGPLRDDPEHAHAFYLPEDADGDGLIDHLIVYCRRGFSARARRGLDSLTSLWIAHGRAGDDGEQGRKEWWLALEDIAAPEAFAGLSGLLRPSCTWHSVTPLLKARFDKTRPRSFGALVESYRQQIDRELTRRFPGLPPLKNMEAGLDPANATRFVIDAGAGRPLSTLAFARTRRGRGGRQPDTAGGSFRLTFETKVAGPIALGWGAHFGLGLFTAS